MGCYLAANCDKNGVIVVVKCSFHADKSLIDRGRRGAGTADVNLEHLAATDIEDGVQGEGANYIRFAVKLSCNMDSNTWPDWWGSDDQHPVAVPPKESVPTPIPLDPVPTPTPKHRHKGQTRHATPHPHVASVQAALPKATPTAMPVKDSAAPYDVGSVLQILQDVTKVQGERHAYGGPNSFIPDVNFLPNYNCVSKMTPITWAKEVANFIATVHSGPWYHLDRPIYFEIGNEENNQGWSVKGKHRGAQKTVTVAQGGYNGYGRSPKNYATLFASVAHAIETAMDAAGASNAPYRILTGGVIYPTTSFSQAANCPGYRSKQFNIDEMNQAISRMGGDRSHLGVAVHPYAYTVYTNQSQRSIAWPNYAKIKGTPDKGCFDLSAMIHLWLTYNALAGLPLIFSEIDIAAPQSSKPGGCNHQGTRPQCEGAYMVDLMTWLRNNPRPGAGSYANPAISPLRVFWYRPNEDIEVDPSKQPSIFPSEGLYSFSDSTPYFSPEKVTISCPNSQRVGVAGTQTESHDFFVLRRYSGPSCWPAPPLHKPKHTSTPVVATTEESTHQGIITTVAGNGIAGYNGDGQLGTMAELNTTSGIGVAVDHAGNLYIADTDNQRIRRVDTMTHHIATVAGTGQKGYGGDGGLATAATLNNPNAVAVARDGTLYIADTDNEIIRRIDPLRHIITTIAGIPGRPGFLGDGGAAAHAQLHGPVALALANNDNVLYVADLDNHVVRSIDLQTHRIATVAGVINTGGITEGRDFGGDGGPATRALLAGVYGLAVDPQGNLFIADTNNEIIRRVDAQTHIITTVAGHYTNLFAGGYSGNGGAATHALLNSPTGLAVNGENDLYIADGNNHVIRQVNLKTGIITIPIGSGTAGDSGDGQPSRQAVFQTPRGLYLDEKGNLYIGDMQANRVRVVGL